MFQWESYVSMGVLLLELLLVLLIIVILVPRSVFTKSSSIKLYKEDKRLLVNSDPWPPAEQKFEMPCDNMNGVQRVLRSPVYMNVIKSFKVSKVIDLVEFSLNVLTEFSGKGSKLPPLVLETSMLPQYPARPIWETGPLN